MLYCIRRIFNILSFPFNKISLNLMGLPQIWHGYLCSSSSHQSSKANDFPLYSSKLTSFITFPLFKFFTSNTFLSFSLSFLVLIVINFSSNHHGDNLFNRCILRVHRSYVCTVSHNRYAVCNFL